jgi:hypothetical protein
MDEGAPAGRARRLADLEERVMVLETLLNVAEMQRVAITPEDAVFIRLPHEAFLESGDGEPPVAFTIARVAADVLGTRRILVLEDVADITVAPLPREHTCPLCGGGGCKECGGSGVTDA